MNFSKSKLLLKFSKFQSSIYFLSSVMHEKISKSKKYNAEKFLSPKNTMLRISKSKKYNASTIANFPKFLGFLQLV